MADVTDIRDFAREAAEAANYGPKKSWVFTHNNWTPEDRQRYLDFESTYCVLGEETSSTGTPHLQGFITFKRAYRFTQLQKLVPGAHWEPAKCADAANYCMKDRYTIQDRRQQGKRNDIEEVRQLVARDAPMHEICAVASGYQTIRFAEKLYQYKPGERNWAPEVFWFYGPSGSGKTRRAYEMFSGDCWISGRNLRWWEGYENQANVIIDDFRYDHCSFSELLRILDRYPYRVEVKGGSRPLLARTIVITCPYHPLEMARYYPNEDVGQLVRRITLIQKFPVDQ